MLRPHNEHWQTLPILAYRVVEHRRSAQLQAVSTGDDRVAPDGRVLLRVVMRRAGVVPWIATIAASLFVLFGPGHENVIWAFQVGFVGSLVCGLAHLILADHDGPLDRRDAIGLLFGIAGLMSSGAGVTMAFVVGLAALLRRGWRAAAFHLVPLAVLFLAWYLVVGRDAYSPSPSSVAEVAKFVEVGVSNTFSQLGQLPGVGIILSVLLVGGLVLMSRGMPHDLFRKQAAATLALFVGGFVFLCIAGIGRIGTAAVAVNLGIIKHATDGAGAGRYVHLVAGCSCRRSCLRPMP